MLKLFTFFIVSVVSLIGVQSIMAQDLQMAIQFGQKGNGMVHNTLMAKSNNGQKFIAGSYMGTIEFDNGSITNSSDSYKGGFIAQIFDDGKIHYINSLKDASVTAMTTTHEGDIVLAGYLRLNNDTLLGTYISFNSRNAHYIACISPKGEMKWINVATSESSGEVLPITAIHQKQEGGILIGFKFIKDFTIGGSEIKADAGRYYGLILAELNLETGELIKIKKISNSSGSEVKIASIKSDDRDNIFLFGQLSEQNKFLGENIDDKSPQFIFLAKLNSDFEKIWLRYFPYYKNEFDIKEQTDAVDMEMDENYNLYITGNFRASLKLDSYFFEGSGGYVAKFDSSANIIWANQYGPYNLVLTSDLALDSINNVFLTGHFFYYAVFGDTVLPSPITPKEGEYFFNSFVVRYNSKGQFTWGFAGGGSDNDKASSIIIDENYMYTHGIFGVKEHSKIPTQATFDNYNLLAPDGNGNPYVLKFNINNFPLSTSNSLIFNVPSITAFPNPSDGISTIQLNGINNKSIPYSIYNLNGKELQQGQLEINEFGYVQLDFSELNKGIYFIQLNINGEINTHKLLKQ